MRCVMFARRVQIRAHRCAYYTHLSAALSTVPSITSSPQNAFEFFFEAETPVILCDLASDWPLFDSERWQVRLFWTTVPLSKIK